MRFPYHYLAVVLVTVGLLGCTGGDANRVPTYPVSGQITMDGSPVADATVTFAPKGDQPTALGRTDAEGRYQLRTYEEADGAAAGAYAVLVSKAVTATSTEPAHDAEGGAFDTSAQHTAGRGAISALPEKYASATTTPLEAVVPEGGGDNFDFTLEK